MEAEESKGAMTGEREMQPPISPPSDNLYKFLAIGGLLCCLTALVEPTRERREFDQASAQYDGDYDQLTAEETLLSESEATAVKQAHTHGKELSRWLESAKKPGAGVVPVPAQLKEEMDRLDQIMNTTRQRRDELIIRRKALDTRRNQLILRRHDLNKLDYIAAFLVPITALASLIGFWKWVGIQRVQDMLQLSELQGPVAADESGQASLHDRSNILAAPHTERPWLRRCGIGVMALGLAGASALYTGDQVMTCTIESSILREDALRQNVSALLAELVHKEMDTNAMEAMRVRRHLGPQISNEELLKAADEWASADPNARSLRPLFEAWFEEGAREERLQERRAILRRVERWGYLISAGLVLIGISFMAISKHTAKKTPDGSRGSGSIMAPVS